MRVIFLACILTMVTMSAKATTVYFCKMDVFLSISEHGLTHYKPKQFTVSLSENEVQFSGDGWLNSEKADIVFIADNEERWEARAPYKFIYFSRGHLNYVHAVEQTQAFNAICEKS